MTKKLYFCKLVNRLYNPKTVEFFYMKKYILGLFAVAVVASCVSQQERAMKSADKDFILKAANENFAKKKWKMHWPFMTDLPTL